MKAPVIESLSGEVLFASSHWIDWIEAFEKEKCEILYPDFSEFTLDDLENITDKTYSDQSHGQEEISKLAEEYFYQNSDQLEPMYNYWYPLPNLSVNSDVAQAILVTESNVCTVVILDDEPVLALAGCGMDFSWNICRAYILLGYLPPFYFCDLPEMTGYSDDLVRDACIESCKVVKDRAISRIQSLEKL